MIVQKILHNVENCITKTDITRTSADVLHLIFFFLFLTRSLIYPRPNQHIDLIKRWEKDYNNFFLNITF